MKKKAITANKWFKELNSVGPFAPYTAPPLTLKTRDTGKVSEELKAVKGVPGVYIIRDKEKVVRYVGATGYSLYTSVLRRFQEWTSTDPNGVFAFDRVTYNPRSGFTAEVIPMKKDKANIWRVEDYYIGKLKPKDNIKGLFDGKAESETEEAYYKRIEKEEQEAERNFILSKRFTDGNNLSDLFDDLRDLILPF